MIRPSSSPAVAVCAAAGALAEVAALGWWAATGSTLVFLGLQFTVVALVWFAVLVLRYRGFRRDYEQAIAVNAVLADRSRLTEEMHDALGHDLSVIALKAGALQVQTTGAVQEQAADIRRDVEHAVQELRRALAAAREPEAPESVEAMIDRLAASGAVIVRRGEVPTRLHPVADRTLYRVVREALTNALRHAPGQAVAVTFGGTAEAVEVEVRNRVPAAEDREARSTAAATGLGALRRRVAVAGGRLEAKVERRGTEGGEIESGEVKGGVAEGGEFTVTAQIPRRPRPAPSVSGTRRSPLWRTVRSGLAPACVALVVLMGFYTWATHDDVIEEGDFDLLQAGMAAAEAERLLPARQAPVRLVPAPAHEPEWSCAYYTDGNFPLGLAVFEVCFHDGAVVRVSDLRERSWL
ncbi:sensor histidine kinase [Glycomyces paridis]|uniref:histidine kinase n=1 Tax=Glycomyces paridis TaxID=2126555 RepID=A0A4S8PG82_9ACTN|nr:histidine kinase [Glycomyces paridis]THV28372.1 hypothetical protein E9998_12250 [Glycomyces paridis]